MHVANQVSAADVRAALARANVPIYVICGRIKLHPVNFSRILNEHLPLNPDLGRRVMAAIEQEVDGR